MLLFLKWARNSQTGCSLNILYLTLMVPLVISDPDNDLGYQLSIGLFVHQRQDHFILNKLVKKSLQLERGMKLIIFK